MPRLLDLFGKISKGKYNYRDRYKKDKGDSLIGEDKDITKGAF